MPDETHDLVVDTTEPEKSLHERLEALEARVTALESAGGAQGYQQQ